MAHVAGIARVGRWSDATSMPLSSHTVSGHLGTVSLTSCRAARFSSPVPAPAACPLADACDARGLGGACLPRDACSAFNGEAAGLEDKRCGLPKRSAGSHGGDVGGVRRAGVKLSTCMRLRVKVTR